MAKPRNSNRLDALTIKAISEPGLYPDGDGLYLQVSRFKTKSWLYRFMRDGRNRKMGLGSVRTVSLAKARQKAREARDQRRDGGDPIEARKAERMAAKLETAKAITFKQCADRYIETHRPGWRNDKHAAQWRASFEETKRGRKIFPAATAAINALPVSAVDTGLVLKVLEPIWYTKPSTAGRLRGRIEQVLDWATVHQYRSGDNPARWRGLLDKALPPRTNNNPIRHHAALGFDDVPTFMAELRAQQFISARALEFTILTAVRTGEAIGAKWSEFDLKKRIWTIPGIRTKSGKEHRVPLSDRALAILEALPREGEYVFPGRMEGAALSNMAMLELLRDLRGKLTVHGFRSSFRDWAAERTNYQNHVVEMALAHVISDKVEAAYRRGDLFDKRAKLMADWARYCEAPASAAVIAFPEKAKASGPLADSATCNARALEA